MAQTAGGTYYAASSELVSSWPATSLDLANQLESRFAAKSAKGSRSKFIPAAAFLTGGGYGITPAVTGGWPNSAARAAFAATGLGILITSLDVPPDYASGLAFTAYFQGGGSGNFRMGIEYAAVTAGTPGGTFFAHGTGDYLTIASYNGLASWTWTTGGSFTAGQLLNVAVLRDGDNAADTSPNACDFFGLRMTYTCT